MGCHVDRAQGNRFLKLIVMDLDFGENTKSCFGGRIFTFLHKYKQVRKLPHNQSSRTLYSRLCPNIDQVNARRPGIGENGCFVTV